MRKQVERFAAVLGVLGIVGCGDDSSTGSSADAAADVSTDTGKHDSSMVMNSDTGTMPPMMVQCGSNMCSPPMSALGGGGLLGGGGAMGGGMAGGMAGGGFSLSACCLSDGGCGAGFGGLPIGGGGGDGGPPCLDPSSGTPDPSCPSMSLIVNLAGCCSNAHVCGVDLSILGLGCNSPSVFGALLGMGDAGPPKPCGDAGGMTAGDSGVTDAGDAGSADADAGASDSATDAGGQDAAHD